MTDKAPTGRQDAAPAPSATDIYIAGLEAEGRQLRITVATLRAKVGELEARLTELEPKDGEVIPTAKKETKK